MIRLLNSNDSQNLMSFLKKEKSFNLFIIGDIESFGYENDFQKIWGETDEDDNFIGVLLKYYQSFVFYSPGDCSFEVFADIIKSHKHDMISGEKSCFDKIKRYFENYKSRETFLTELDEPVNYTQKEFVTQITVDDIEDILKQRRLIKEFSLASYNDGEAIRKNLETKSGRIYCIRKNGEIVSSAATTAETSDSAMIVGVCTLKEFRNYGYATQCMEKLCHDLQKEGKTPCLFYDNPSAGKIYKKIGFRDIGRWVMLKS